MKRGSQIKSRPRGKREHVKTARRRKVSSTRWLERQLNDPYVAAARAEGYRARSAFKLKEIAERYDLFKGARVIVDLGSAPGGWCQVVREMSPKARVIAVDLTAMAPIAGIEFIRGDFLDEKTFQRVMAASAGGVNVVLSDMANPATGHRATDQLKTMALAEAAADFALRALKPDGAFLAKVLQGGGERELLATLKGRFAKVFHVKPPASRQDSRELYVLAQGFRGEGPSATRT
ncbi:MAG TPA: RlmE family RNA methyltransferase [Sphingomonadales bacterium]|nr:RlmE family RNA methyltransferase [Sphingomonadales bacterium]